jgi:hypothetical protein
MQRLPKSPRPQTVPWTLALFLGVCGNYQGCSLHQEMLRLLVCLRTCTS